MEHGLEQLYQSCKIIHAVHLLKILAQGLQVLHSVIGLQTRCVDILQQPATDPRGL